jgi:hypothetical protein
VPLRNSSGRSSTSPSSRRPPGLQSRARRRRQAQQLGGPDEEPVGVAAQEGRAHDPDGDKKFKIGALKIVDPVIHFRSAAFPDGILLDLKDVELKKVGNTPDSSSKTYIVLASILQAILTGGIKEGTDLPRSVTGSLKEELSEAGKAFGDVLKEIK